MRQYLQLPYDYKPGGGFNFTTPTGLLIQATTFAGLVMEANAACRNLPDFDHRELIIAINEQMCAQEFPNGGKLVDGRWVKPFLVGGLTLEQLKEGAGQVSSAMLGKIKLADADEARRRAKLCEVCDQNVRVSSCKLCEGMVKFIAGVNSGDSEIENLDRLDTCKRCGCFIKALVWWEKDKLKKVDGLPALCWRN
jgi:hypothetical protein